MTTTRTRSRDERTLVTGVISYYQPPAPDAIVTALQGPDTSCTDTIGNPTGDNPFDLYRKELSYGVLVGTKYDTYGNKVRTLSGVPMAYLPVMVPTNYWSSDDLATLKLEVQSRSNPSVPSVSIPTFIGELKDLPDLVRSWGRGFIRKVANANLWYRFGVRPLLGDLERIFDFQRAVQQRLKMLKNLRDSRSVRRRVQLEHSRQTGALVRKTMHTNGAIVYARECLTHVKDMWGTSKWVLDPGVALPRSDEELKSLATRLTLGFTTFEALATLWELLPWSWLVDWFAHIGDFISASNNSLPLRCTGVCIMRTFNTVARYTDFDYSASPWVRAIGRHESEGTRKLRNVFSGDVVLPAPSIPALTAGQWSILGSLAALKGLKVH